MGQALLWKCGKCLSWVRKEIDGCSFEKGRCGNIEGVITKQQVRPLVSFSRLMGELCSMNLKR